MFTVVLNGGEGRGNLWVISKSKKKSHINVYFYSVFLQFFCENGRGEIATIASPLYPPLHVYVQICVKLYDNSYPSPLPKKKKYCKDPNDYTGIEVVDVLILSTRDKW